RGHREEAEALLRQGEELVREVPGTIADAVHAYVRAFGDWVEGSNAAAIRRLAPLRTTDPALGEAWVLQWGPLLVAGRVAAGRVDEAEVEVEGLRALAATVGPAAEHLGLLSLVRVHLGRRQLSDALATYQRADQLDAASEWERASIALDLGAALVE